MKKNYKKLLCAVLIIISVLSVCLLSACDSYSDEIYYIDQDMRYSFDTLQSTVMSMPFMVVLDSKETYIQLNKDKTIKIRFVANSSLLNNILEESEVNLGEMINGIDIEENFNAYASELFPGADINDLQKTFTLLTESLNITLMGADYINEESEKITKILKKEIPFPDEFTLPDTLGIEINENYYIKDVQTDEGTAKGVFVGQYNPDTDPFFILTMYEKEQYGKAINKLSMRIEFVQFYANLTQTVLK